MNTFALVPSAKDLPRACGDLSDFLVFRRRQNPTLLPDTLLGIWTDPSLATRVPQAIPGDPEVGEEPCISVVETLGVPAAWSLCWLNRAISRSHFARALKTLSKTQGDTGNVHFIPVLCKDGSEKVIKAEIQALRNRSPGLLMEPLYQERATGRLFAFHSSDARLGKMQ